jgi:hypothetical protein
METSLLVRLMAGSVVCYSPASPHHQSAGPSISLGSAASSHSNCTSGLRSPGGIDCLNTDRYHWRFRYRVGVAARLGSQLCRSAVGADCRCAVRSCTDPPMLNWGNSDFRAGASTGRYRDRMDTCLPCTRRLLLEAPSATDIDAITAACRDPDIQRWVPIPVPYARQEAEG